jgi:hypothetical protein
MYCNFLQISEGELILHQIDHLRKCFDDFNMRRLALREGGRGAVFAIKEVEAVVNRNLQRSFPEDRLTLTSAYILFVLPFSDFGAEYLQQAVSIWDKFKQMADSTYTNDDIPDIIKSMLNRWRKDNVPGDPTAYYDFDILYNMAQELGFIPKGPLYDLPTIKKILNYPASTLMEKGPALKEKLLQLG